MPSTLAARLRLARSRLADRVLDFRPSIVDLPLEGCRARFLVATAQAAEWYAPMNERNRREIDWLLANVPLSGERVIDGGAFHGLYAVVFGIAAGPNGRVVAVDPVASNAAVVEANLALNGVAGEVVVCAIAGVDGEVAFSRDSCGRILPSGGITVPARRLASIAPDATVVKLDIEGEEFGVLPAQIDDLSHARAWIVEIHPGRGRDVAALVDLFRTRGFAVWWSRPDAGMSPYRGEAWTVRGTLVAIR